VKAIAVFSAVEQFEIGSVESINQSIII